MKRFLLFAFPVLLAYSSIAQQEIAKRETIFEDSFDKLTISNWKPGMTFLVLSDQAKDLQPYKKSKKSLLDLDRSIATFKGYRKGAIENVFTFEIGGELWVYRTPFEDVRGLVYFSSLKRIRDSLIGKQLFVLTDLWIKNAADARRTPYKYFKVTVDSIVISENSFVPYRIHFTSDEGVNGYCDVQIGEVNVIPSDEYKFSSAFSYVDPRLLYAGIPDEYWTLITRGKVKPGMSKLECRLSFGKPRKVNKTISETGVSEQWVYNDQYLYFTGEILKSIQTNE